MIQKSAFVRLTAASLIIAFIGLTATRADIPFTPGAASTLETKLQERVKRDPQEHLSVTEFKELYSELITQSGQRMDVAYEHYEQFIDTARKDQPWWHDFMPKFGWITAAIFMVLMVFRDFLLKRIETAVQTLWDKGYRRLAGLRLFRRWALRRYRRSIIANHRLLKIPFRPDRPLEMERVFVRLKLEGSEAGTLIDAEQAVDKARVCVVLGPAGSGKSMLMRKLCLTLASSSAGTPQQPVPVLIELSRVTEAEGSIRERLIASFAQNDFPNADKFVDAGFEKGFLLLLLDGLDEVSSEKKADGFSSRDRVVQQIEDLASKHRSCRFLITCRSAVYHGELDECADQRLSIVEFTDEQIQLFLHAWDPEMPTDKSVEQLLRNLRERPRIMLLARNPLLLTIIAFLYTDTEFILPHSRAEFYEKAVDALLDHWKRDRNRFKRAHKALVLQHLALWNQDNAPADNPDRRTMDLGLLLAEIRTILHTLNWPETDAQAMLDEITERSGLLMAIDGGQRYQYTHLTLQEFMAAKKLEADMEGLLRRLEKAPDDWRETIKLWCGLPHDSTQLITRLRTFDPVLALECLSDTEQLNDAIQKSILDEFKPRIAEVSQQGESIIRSFALLAADPRPRGQEAFRYLKEVLFFPTSSEARFAAACRALSLTNLPQAAECLAQVAVAQPLLLLPPSRWPAGEYTGHINAKHEIATTCLVHMGDISVPALGTLGDQEIPEIEWVPTALRDIGSPLAAQQLVKFLHSPWDRLAEGAAWALGALVRHPTIEASLSKLPILSLSLGSARYLWVWEPFSGAGSPTTLIMARVAALIRQNNLPVFHSRHTLDARLVLSYALAEKTLPEKYLSIENDRMFDSFLRLEEELKACATVEARDQLKGAWIQTAAAKWWPTISPILAGASLEVKWDLLTLASRYGPISFTTAEWQNLNRPSDYNYAASWHAKMVGGTACLLLLLMGFGLLHGGSSAFDNWRYGASVCAAGILWVLAALALLTGFVAREGKFWEISQTAADFCVPWLALTLPCVAMPFAISARAPDAGTAPWAYALVWGLICSVPAAVGIAWNDWRWSRRSSEVWQPAVIITLWSVISCLAQAWFIKIRSDALFSGAINSCWRIGVAFAIFGAYMYVDIRKCSRRQKKLVIVYLAAVMGFFVFALPALMSFFLVLEIETLAGHENLMPVIALICTFVGIIAASANYQKCLSSNKLRAALEEMESSAKWPWFKRSKSLHEKLTVRVPPNADLNIV